MSLKVDTMRSRPHPWGRGPGIAATLNWRRWALAAMLTLAAMAASAAGQTPAPLRPGESAAATDTSAPVDMSNPLSIIEQAGKLMPVGGVAVPGQTPSSGGLSATLSILLLLTVLTIAPSLVIMMTSFTRIVIVLSLLRQAIGTQSLPPSQVLVGLALFMTFLVMGPTFSRINQEALVPLQNNAINSLEAWDLAKRPLRQFMFDQIDHAGNYDDVYMIMNYRGLDTSQPEKLYEDDVDMLTLVPAFILSELKIAFLMGFRLYLPFLIVDMVIASVLISMGMLMLPPVLISLPFKLLLFVLVDGWHLVAGSLLNSFAVPGVTT